MIDEYVGKNHEKAKAFHSLGALRFLSFLSHSNAIIGNSSSGILEAPSLHIATINIGDRQRGRTQAKSIVNCNCNIDDIIKAFEKVKDLEFNESLNGVINPYENGGAASKILDVIKSRKNINSIKKFNNLTWN